MYLNVYQNITQDLYNREYTTTNLVNTKRDVCPSMTQWPWPNDKIWYPNLFKRDDSFNLSISFLVINQINVFNLFLIALSMSGALWLYKATLIAVYQTSLLSLECCVITLWPKNINLYITIKVLHFKVGIIITSVASPGVCEVCGRTGSRRGPVTSV